MNYKKTITDGGWLMSKLSLCIAVVIMAGITAGQSEAEREWSRITGTNWNDYGEAVAVDGMGYPLVAGTYQTNDLTAYQQFYLSKWDEMGVQAWDLVWGSTYTTNAAYGVAVDMMDYIYVAGFTRGMIGTQNIVGAKDFCLSKISPGGSLEWLQIWGSTNNDEAFDVDVAPDDTIYVVGDATDDVSSGINSGGVDACLSHYLFNGNVAPGEWVKMIGSPSNDYGRGVAVDCESNVYVAGHTYGQWGGETNSGLSDAFLTRIDGSGTVVWTRMWGSMQEDYVLDVAVDEAGYIYVVGTTEGEFDDQTNAGMKDAFLTKYNQGGGKEWTRIWGTPSNDVGSGVSFDGHSDPIVCGDTFGTFPGQTNNAVSRDFFITKHNQDGDHVWSRMWGSSVTDESTGIAVCESNVYVSGFTFGMIDSEPLIGGSDIYAGKWVTSDPTGWISIDVVPDDGSWVMTSYPMGYVGPAGGTGDLMTTLAPVGSYQVNYNPMPGFAVPSNQFLSVNVGTETAFTGVYTRLYGSISIDVQPASGMWSIVASPMDYSGEFMGVGDLATTNVPTGVYGVEYSPIPGHGIPPAQTNTVSSGIHVSFTGMYRRASGWLSIDVTPTNATWALTNAPPDYAGPRSGTGNLVEEPATLGKYAVRFNPLAAYATPAPMSVMVESGIVTIVEASYELLDSDFDGLTDFDEENVYNTDPYNADTDGDGYGDGKEVNSLSDPLDANSYPRGNLDFFVPDSETHAKAGRLLEISWTGTQALDSVDVFLKRDTSTWDLLFGVPATNDKMTVWARLPNNLQNMTNYHVKVSGTTKAVEFGDSPMFGICDECKSDYDGDGRADMTVYFPPWGMWYIDRSTKGLRMQQFGWDGPVAVPADYDGDCRTDIALYFPPNGMWYLLMSTHGYRQVQFGDGTMLPVPADYNGDGRVDLGVYQPSTGIWILHSLGGEWHEELQFGFETAGPVPGDYDGDGIDDPAIFNAHDGMWFILASSEGFSERQFGWPGPVPVPDDYDGDGRADLALYDPGPGEWHILMSSGGYSVQQFGFPGPVPVPADYDGDGRIDKGLFSGPEGLWYLLMTTDGFEERPVRWGEGVP